MAQHYNKPELKERRRQLRKEMTYCEKIMWIHLRKKQLGVRFLRIKNDELMGNANKTFERIENEIKSLRNPSFIKGAEI
jgi:very-short-patch-repair endonuclease